MSTIDDKLNEVLNITTEVMPIEVEKKENSTNSDLANQAIKKAFTNLSEKILLDVDFNKLSDLKFGLLGICIVQLA